MAVLFDLFSYRVKNSSDGLYFDRWHGNTFPEISMPEKLYFLSRIISALMHLGCFMKEENLLF